MSRNGRAARAWLALGLACAGASAAGAADWTWIGGCGAGNWFDVCTGDYCNYPEVWHWNNWGDTACPPGTVAFPAATDNVAFNSLAHLNGAAATIGNVHIGATGELSLENGGTLTVQGGTVNSSGALWLRYGGYYGDAHLALPVPTGFIGSGALHSEGGVIEGAGPLILNAEHTIVGRSLRISAPLDNAGTVSADQAGGVIALRDTAKQNSGVLQAVNNAYLDISTPITQTAQGRVLAAGGTVRFYSGAHVVGGRLESTGASQCAVDGQTVLLENVTNLGTVGAANGAVVALRGSTLTNEGTLALSWGGYYGNSTLRCDTAVTIAGAGEIVTAGALFIGNPFVQAATHTLRGRDATLSAGFENFGLVHADQNGGVMTLTADPKTNHGVLKASGGGVLQIATTVYQADATAQIIADGGTVQYLSGAHIVSGTLATAGSGTQSVNGQTLILSDVANTGTLNAANGAVLALRQKLTNTGTIGALWGGYYGNSTVRFDTNNLYLQGSGTLLLSGAALTSPNGEYFRNTALHTIRGGSATISAPCENEGLIHADQNGGSIALQGADKGNAGVLKASGGGYLDVSCRVIQTNDLGQIVADDGTVRLYNGAEIVGGTLHTDGTGVMVADAATCILQGVTSTGHLRAGNGGRLALRGTLTNNGQLDVYYGGYHGRGGLEFETNTLIGGAGEIVLMGANLTSAGGYTATFGAEQSVHGYDADLHVACDNYGLLASTVNGGVIGLRSAPKSNHGTMKAGAGAYLDIYVPVYQSDAARIVADGGTVRLAGGAALHGGLLETLSGGQFVADAATCVLDGVTNLGRLRAGNGGRFVAGSALWNEGLIEIYYGGYYGNGHFELSANCHLIGNGTLNLASGDVISSVGAFLQNGAGHTLTGGGPVSVALLNDGIVAPGNGVGVLNVNGGYTQTLSGTLRIQVLSAGQYDRLNVSGPAAVGGTVTMVPTGGFVPQTGQQFTVLSAAGVLGGAFAGVVGPGRYTVANAGQNVIVTVTNGSGDLNGDGSTGAGDLAPFMDCLHGPDILVDADCRAADYDDGDVDLVDLAAFQRAFGL